MKDQISEELLSAYFDGELSSKERIRVERWLTSSPEAKQQVADYRRLSRMFEGLSRTEVSQEFAAEVLQLAERRMLLPEASVMPRRRQIRVLWVAIPVTAAAALVLTLNFWNRNPEPGRGVAQTHDRGATSRTTLVVPDTGSGRTDVHEPGDHRSDKSHATYGPVPADEAGGAVAATGAAADNQPAENVDSAAGVQVADGDSLQSEAEQRAANVVDEALVSAQDVAAEGRAIPVVTIYVDGIEGLTLLQEIFADYRILSASTEKSDEGQGIEPRQETLPGTAGSTPDRQALYVVVTDAEPLIRSFAEMIQARHTRVRIEAQEPIILADLDRDSQQRVAQIEEEVAQNVARVAEQRSKSLAGSDQPAETPQAGAQAEAPKSAPTVADSKADEKRSSGRPIARGGPSRIGSRSLKKWERSSAEIEHSASVPPPADNKLDDPEVAADAEKGQPQEALSRQVRVPVPAVYQKRSRGDNPNSSRGAKPARAPEVRQPAANDGTRAEERNVERPQEKVAEQSESDDNSDNREPEIVQLLIVVEIATPSAAPLEKPAAK